MRSAFSKLRVRLLLLVTLALLPVLGLILYSNHEQRSLAVVDVQTNALRVVRLAANDQERLIEGARQLLVALAQLPSVQNHDPVTCSRFLADLLKQYPLYENLGAATTNGVIFCSAVPSATTASMADRPAFKRVLETNDFVAGDYIIARISGRPTLSTLYPVLDEAGRLHAVVFAGIDLAWFDAFVAEAQLPEGSTLSVVDNAGIILTRYPEAERWRGMTLPASLMQPLLAQGEGVAEGPGLDGVPRLYAFTRLCCLPSGDIYVRVGIPVAVAFAQANRTLTRNLIVLGVVTLLVFALAGAGVHLLVLQPVNALLSAVRRFDAGDFSTRTGRASGRGELGQLARAFDRMAATVEARDRERDRAAEALGLQTARAEALTTIAARLNAHLDLRSVLQEVCQETVRALQVSASTVSLYEEDLDTLHIVSHCGLPEDFGERIEALGWSTCTRQLRTAEAVVIPDIQAQPELPAASLFAELGIRTYVSTPMVHEGRLVGTVCVFARQVRQFAEGELAFLKAISDQAAQAITNARLYEKLQQEQRSRAALLDKTISAQEDERKRIARELHDQTSQDLAALMLSLDACTMELAADGPGAEQHLCTAKTIAEEMLTSVHRLINDLRPSLLDDLGLAPAILWYGEQRLKPMGIALEFQCDRMDTRLPPFLETALFRIAQEAFTNIVRHANATRVNVILKVNGPGVFLSVRDNGMGFQMPAAGWEQEEGRGLGLRGMEERVIIQGGTLQIQSALGQGTTIQVNIPVVREEHSGV
jgi:signal transduction histidine kinase